MQEPLWAGVVGALLVAGAASLASHRRARRAALDRVGWVDWSLVLILSLIVAAICAALALHR